MRLTSGGHREAFESADVAGIDAEWEPYTRTASASLVQIAVRSETHTCIVLLVSLCRAYCSVDVYLYIYARLLRQRP